LCTPFAREAHSSTAIHARHPSFGSVESAFCSRHLSSAKAGLDLRRCGGGLGGGGLGVGGGLGGDGGLGGGGLGGEGGLGGGGGGGGGGGCGMVASAAGRKGLKQGG